MTSKARLSVMNSGPWSSVAPLQHEDRTKRGFLRVTASIGVGTLVSLIATVGSNAAETTGPEAPLAPAPRSSAALRKRLLAHPVVSNGPRT